MLHRIPPDRAGAATEEMSRAVEACVHCGFCLPACPTYAVMGEEMNSPRGRIFLMKETLEGRLAAADTQQYIDKCLGCLACETACPSGVRYGELLTPYRAWTRGGAQGPHLSRAQSRDALATSQADGATAHPSTGRGHARHLRKLLLATLPYPKRFRLAAHLGRLGKPFRRLLPESLRGMLDLVPDRLPPAVRLATTYPATGRRRGRVALLAGCAQQVLAPQINAATIRVLQRNGVEVLVPPSQGCCGALAMHLGESEAARKTARLNLAAFPSDVDAILTNAAGCGSGLHEYGLLFKGEPEHAEAVAFAHRCQDVSVYLEKLGLIAPAGAVAAGAPKKVAYHDACHLAHAQRVRAAPRKLLAAIPGIQLVEPAEWELCCGSAGTYNLEQPEIAAQLGRRKAQNLIATGAELIATGNIGCLTQIAAHLKLLGKEIPIVHPIVLLDEAYGGAHGPHELSGAERG